MARAAGIIGAPGTASSAGAAARARRAAGTAGRLEAALVVGLTLLILATAGAATAAFERPSTGEAQVVAGSFAAGPAAGPRRAAATPQPPALVLGPAPAPPSQRPDGTLACGMPPSDGQRALDQQVLAAARARGLLLVLGRQCDGYTLFYQQGVDLAAIAQFTDGMETAFGALASGAGGRPARRAAMFLFADEQARRRAVGALGDPNRQIEVPRMLGIATGLAFGGDVWIDVSRAGSEVQRYATAAHEMTHVFVAAAAGGHFVPRWLDEGLATYDQVTIPPPKFQTEMEREAVQRRRVVLDALVGAGSVRLFPLAALSSEAQWDGNYVDASRQALQYAQAYAGVAWLEERHGGPAVWRLLTGIGSDPTSSDRPSSQADDGSRFASLFERAFGLTPSGFEAALRDAWRSGGV